MSDMYGISNAVMEQNSLHGQIALERENRQANFKKRKDAFDAIIKSTKGADNTATEKDTAENVSDIQQVITTGKGIFGRVKGAASGAVAGVQTSVAAQSAQAGEGLLLSARDLNPAGITQSGEALSSESSLASGARTLGGALAGGARTTGAGVKGALSGFVSGADEAFGGTSLPTKATFDALKTADAGGEGLTGLEGIVQKGLVKAGGGEALGVVGGKAAGAFGGFLDAGKEIDSLVQTGGKSAYTRVDAQGNRVAESSTDKWGERLTEAGSALDVASAFTGGLLVPLAGAVSLAGAITGVIGDYEDQKTDNKKVGINADGSTDSTKAPKLSDTALPQGEAFTSLGFVGNLSHNPLANI